MRRLLPLLAAALLFPTVLQAQNGNELSHGGDNVSYASNGRLNRLGGWLFKRFASFAVVGNQTLGNQPVPGRIDALRFTVQDQDGSTSATLNFGAFGPDPQRADLPACPPTPATTLLALGPFTTPPSGFSGPSAWILTLAPTTPAAVLPLDGEVFLGLQVPPSPTPEIYWQADASVTSRGLPDHEITCAAGGGIGSIRTQPLIPKVRLFTSRPVLELGFRDASGTHSFGPRGQFLLAGDGLSSRIRDGSAGDAAVFLFASLGARQSSPTPAPALGGWFALPLAQLYPSSIAVGTLDARGELVLPSIVPAGLAPTGSRITIQGLVVPARGGFRLTNAVDAAWN